MTSQFGHPPGLPAQQSMVINSITVIDRRATPGQLQSS